MKFPKSTSGLLSIIPFMMMAQYVRSFRSVVVGSSSRDKFSIQQQLAVGLSSTQYNKRSLSFSSCRLYATSTDDTNGKKRIVFLGTPEVAADSLKTLHEESQKHGCPYKIVGVVTQPPKRRKRKGKLEPSPVGLVAEELEIPVLCPESVSFSLYIIDSLWWIQIQTRNKRASPLKKIFSFCTI